MREEFDSLGKVLVPEDKLWGAQTQRSIENFKIGPSGSMPIEIIKSYAILKKAAAYANSELSNLSKEKKEVIEIACNQIESGDYDDHFPLVIWQTGSGTQTNMNVNEVISNLVKKNCGFSVHPNDDVNMSQSSNDTFPTAMHIAAYKMIINKTLPSLEKLKLALFRKSELFTNIVKIGRTHLMDATPITVGQEFAAYVTQLDNGIKALKNTLEHLSELPIGGTAVGTGINAPNGYDKIVVNKINEFTSLSFQVANNKFSAIATHDAFVESHGALKQIAVSLYKIANDIRLLASGPRCGIGEIQLPANEPGSSIMPGKVNPTQCEALTMVCAQVLGNDSAISFAGSQGQFQLNVFKPMIAYNFLYSARIMADACNSFTEKCINGILINEKKIHENLNNSLMLVTALNSHIGYDSAAKIAKEAYDKNITLKEAAVDLGFLTESEFDNLVKPHDMINPQ
ncbi:MAG: fumarate hydratase, class II [Flavobacteriales bacterium]|jgi:fumarate hydratase class II|nr:fumarate hydratase, class II [Flavobacteriales bacterium]|tara:strand:- start:139 stop:1506 length:1368 start_codon:yes stop_codon:yes gene_type:complete